MVSPSRCPPWQPERPGPTRREPRRAQRSYTTPRDTIIRRRLGGRSLKSGHLMAAEEMQFLDAEDYWYDFHEFGCHLGMSANIQFAARRGVQVTQSCAGAVKRRRWWPRSASHRRGMRHGGESRRLCGRRLAIFHSWRRCRPIPIRSLTTVRTRQTRSRPSSAIYTLCSNRFLQMRWLCISSRRRSGSVSPCRSTPFVFVR